jgi:hypothetical protein
MMGMAGVDNTLSIHAVFTRAVSGQARDGAFKIL